MELKQLEHFCVAAEMNHISKAAEQLYITQPALTKSIARLEQELGVQLFDRDKKRIYLNENGREILKCAERVLDEVQALEACGARLRERQKPLHVMAECEVILRHLVPSLAAVNPELHVTWEVLPCAEILQNICAGEAAFGLTRTKLPQPGVSFLPLYEEHASVIVPQGHRLYGYDQIPLRELDGETIVFARSNDHSGEDWKKRLAKHGARVKLTIVDDWLMYTNAVQMSRNLIASSDIAVKYLPAGSHSKNVILERAEEGFTHNCYYFVIAENRKDAGELYLQCKTALQK